MLRLCLELDEWQSFIHLLIKYFAKGLFHLDLGGLDFLELGHLLEVLDLELLAPLLHRLHLSGLFILKSLDV